jgi:hypothetical protein
MRAELGLSERRVCRVLGQRRSTQRKITTSQAICRAWSRLLDETGRLTSLTDYLYLTASAILRAGVMRPVRGWSNRGRDDREGGRLPETGSVDNQCSRWGCLKAPFASDQAASGIRMAAVRFKL